MNTVPDPVPGTENDSLEPMARAARDSPQGQQDAPEKPHSPRRRPGDHPGAGKPRQTEMGALSPPAPARNSPPGATGRPGEAPKPPKTARRPENPKSGRKFAAQRFSPPSPRPTAT